MALAVEASGGGVPSARVITETHQAVTVGSRLDFVDTEPGPKWIDARTSENEVVPGTYDKSAKRPDPRHTEEVECDGRYISFQLIVPMWNREPQKWWGKISRRQWEKVGLEYKGCPQEEFADENALEATQDMPGGVDPDVRAAVAKERLRIASIPAPHLARFFGEDPDPAPLESDDAPTVSFMPPDTDYLDNLVKPYEDYAQ